ncbi:DUF4129 domain-containing protein [Luteimonas sp. 22616]|uniref:DUF4129 domain-containing protein n=1 Tax=Luteimonas sp. 22616 TaxID=3453951 RepID=UPI003F825BEC
MKLESLRVELRPRSPWEAVELGTALVRRNAAAIWIPWLLLVAPVFVAVNLAALAVDRIWLAWLAMWWLKPLFDRIVLFVLSRAVFGETPTTRQTLAAQRSWGWRAMRGHLLWRRISLTRALALPVDLLEGADGGRLRERRRVLGDAVRGQGMLLTLVCLLFVVALSLSMLSLALLFVPWEFLPESVRATWSLLTVQPPRWAQVVLHAVVWIATSAIEPFYVGAGFGLYLNRRTRIEAWDVEIALRRMRTRLATTATVLLLAVGAISILPLPSQAAPGANAVQDDAVQPPARTRIPQAGDGDAARLDDVFGDARVDDPGFDKAVEQAYRDPLLRPKRKQSHWRARERERHAPPPNLPFPALAKAIAFIGEFGLWLLLLALLVLLAATAKRWLPWLRGGLVARPSPTPVEVAEATLPDVLPEDIVAAARRLWREGRPRRALALLYRASVEAMAVRAAVTLVPGATESECLRASRRMPDPQDRDAFARVVRVWQYAAYAQRLPDEGAFDGLLDTLAQRFGWAR